jgi:hypothetical protein
VKQLILPQAIEKNEFKDILFDYDIYGIRPSAGATFVSMKENTDIHAITGGHRFSEPCCPLIRRKMPGGS